MAQLLIAAVTQQGRNPCHDACIRVRRLPAILAAALVAAGAQEGYHLARDLLQLVNLLKAAESGLQDKFHPAAANGVVYNQLVALDKSLDFRRIRLLSAVSQGKNKRNKILVAGAAHQHHMQAALHPKENAALRVCCQVKPLGHLIQIILLGFTHVENSPYLSVFQPPDAGGRPVHISWPR
jgi:hypothetical protein